MVDLSIANCDSSPGRVPAAGNTGVQMLYAVRKNSDPMREKTQRSDAIRLGSLWQLLSCWNQRLLSWTIVKVCYWLLKYVTDSQIVEDW